MKRLLPLLLILVLISAGFSRTQPGKSSLAARLTDFGHEFGFGRMTTPTSMILLDASVHYTSSSEESTVGSQTVSGPQSDDFMMYFFPEYRYYVLPRGAVTPYIGVFGVFGFGMSSSEQTAGTNVTVTNGSALAFGVGASFGAEFFLNNNVSLVAHSRLAQFSSESQKSESDNGFQTQEDVHRTSTLSVQIEPALYVRIYF